MARILIADDQSDVLAALRLLLKGEPLGQERSTNHTKPHEQARFGFV
jgi:hypothetical protein